MRAGWVLLIMALGAVGSVDAQSVLSVSGGGLAGGQVTVSVGASRGVKAGMKAKVMAWEGSGEQRHEVPIANIEVVTVSETTCTAKILAVGQGYAVQRGMRVAFAAKLGPPPTAPAKPPPAAGADGRAAQEKAAAGGVPEAVRRMTLMEKIGYAKKQLDAGNYERAVAVYELVSREAPDDALFADDYRAARDGLAREQAAVQQREAERKELDGIRQNLDFYRASVAKYESDHDWAKALEFQRMIGRVDASAAAQDKLADLEYRLAVSKLPAAVYPEHIQAIAAKYPERSRELQEKARQNATARAEREAAERARAEAARQAEAERRRREDPDQPPTGGPTGRTFTNSLGMAFVELGPGTFTMGSDNGDSDEKPRHRVTISRAFMMETTEVTQGQWRAVMGDNPSKFKKDDTRPVEQVSWDDVQNFIQRLNQLDPGKNYRLPTEAEWEYACRAGSTGDRYGDLDSIAWYDGNSGGKTHPVGQKQPNAWGLYDMLGNVWEWCQDWYGAYPSTAVTDPTGPLSGSYRVFRGGSWLLVAGGCRSANRYGLDPGYRDLILGFRLARSLP